ncbi:hypothetical protein [Mycoplasma zalophidermidis]|uniref:hypothetical protein n=1 Tax=Mycoplasma zalophidermidis TaxID=398174 RepID=UPI00215D5237|nr:hypothetical protein [Mycoplasma zalophidermidis]MCR8966248.1 hypothetical protein [Mycoplasma zalophidermidis]
MKLLEQLFARYGYPIGLKTDRRTTFFAKQENNTPMAQWLKSKNIKLESKSYGKFKPNVERTNGTIQLWLIEYLKNKNYLTIEAINLHSKEIIQAYNHRFNKHINNKTNLFKKINKKNNEHKVFSPIKRKYSAGCVQYMNNYYVPITDENKRFYMDDGVANFVMNSSGDLMFIIEDKIFKSECLKGEQLTDYQIFCKRHYLIYGGMIWLKSFIALSNTVENLQLAYTM